MKRNCRRCNTRKHRHEFGVAYCLECEEELKRPNILKYAIHACERCAAAIKEHKSSYCKYCNEREGQT